MQTNECVVYAVEHPNHICDVFFPPITDENIFKKKCLDNGAVWIERLCTVNTSLHEDEEVLLTRHCSREMISLYHELNGGPHFLPSDVAEKLLETGRSEWGWMQGQSYGPDTVLFFPPHHDPDQIVHPYDERWLRDARAGTVDLFIQDAMVRPICTLSVDKNDLRHADCDWRECLGTVQANHVGAGSVEVRLDDINVLVRQCSIPMVAMSQCMPPLYIPKKWLARAVRKPARTM
jgi:hypothetical protein